MAKAPVKQQEQALATTGGAQLPDYLRGHTGGSGLQGLNADDFIVPRVKLLQGLSPELEVFENAKQGLFWVNVLDELLGSEFEFTPLINRKRAMLQPPMGGGQTGIFARSNDGITWNTTGEWTVKLKGVREPVKWAINDLNVRKSGLLEYGTSNPDDPDSPPAATTFYDFLIVVHGGPVDIPVLMSLARSAAKKAKDLQMKIEAMRAPMWSRKFVAKPFKDSNSDGQDFWNWQFAGSGFVSQDFFNAATATRERFQSMNFRGAEDDVDDGATAAADSNREF